MGFSTSSTRPPAIPPFKTYFYKRVKKNKLQVDVYLPSNPKAQPLPVTLYIPGGGWTSVDRTDYSRPLFYELLSYGFIVCCINYRLLPESSFTEQKEDVKDVETWIRKRLPGKMESIGVRIDGNKIVVGGGSAGGHLALLTPTLWERTPSMIFALYAPTNMHKVPFLNRGRLSLSECEIPDCTPDLLASATDYKNPPSEFAVSQSEEDFKRPRRYLGLHTFRKGIAEFLVTGLEICFDGDGREELRLPEKGSVKSEAIDDISPYHLCTKFVYPQTFLIMGTKDEVFDISHMFELKKQLKRNGVHCRTMVADGHGHAFDVWAAMDGEVHLQIVKPFVKSIVEAMGM